MANNVIAVYPGTFDPLTRGHEDIVRRAMQLFGKVIVAVAAGHHKKNALFTLQERLEMVREVAKDHVQVEVDSYSGLLRDFVVARGAKAVVRGLRAVTDFDYEFQLAGMNRTLMPDVETVPVRLQHLRARDCAVGRRGGQVCVAVCAPATAGQGEEFAEGLVATL
jgi:pantetheine-phosphate adenylyltransferase